MKICGHLLRQPGRVAFVCVLGMLLCARTGGGQLAITEMMSAALQTNGLTISTNNSDFWELTNFGSDPVDVAGFLASDNKNMPRFLPLLARPIAPGESVIFVRDNATLNEAQFRAWWGSCVGPDVQIGFYSKPGFGSGGDSIRVFDQARNLVDSVDFGPAIRGVSFIYATNTGLFGARSLLGQGGTCRAGTAVDIASPGVTTGPIPLRIVQQPMNRVVCEELDTTFKVDAIGMPRPRYQWLFNGSAIAGANQASLTITNVTPADAGVYSVSITNGLTVLLSSNAMLTLRTTLSGPTVVVPPVSLTVVTNRTARFSISVCAFPSATHQWFADGVALTGETNGTLFIRNCRLEMSGTEYCVRAGNSIGTTTQCAKLYVTTTPVLRITEVEAAPVTGNDQHHDWFEVTNFGTQPVDLLGYRFFDGFTPSALASAVVITQSMVLQPHESAIFVKNPVPTIFIDWWGPERLPRGLKIFAYGGFSLGKDGDELYLWDASAEDPDEAIDAISFAGMVVGRSLRYDPELCPFGCESVPGESGAFRAAQNGDIGSPGYTANPPPRFVRITQDAAGASLQWRAVEGATDQLEYSWTPQTDVWISLGNTTALDSLTTMTDPSATNASRRFYRVRRLTP